MPLLHLPGPLRRSGAAAARVPVAGGSIRQIFADLQARRPRIAARILDAEGALRRHLRVFVNGCDIRALRGEATPVREDDEVRIVPALAR